MKLLPLGIVLVCLPAWPQNAGIEQGRAIFRSNCAFCHGLTGRGGRGPNLVSHPIKDLKDTVRNGVPGTTMPAFQDFEEKDLDQLEQFIRHLAGSDTKPALAITGDPAAGRRVYQRYACGSCHRTGVEGSVYGPELTRIGSARSAEYLRESVLEPSHDIPAEYEGVAVTTASGDSITGVRINEDTFTLQLRDASQQFRLFRKDELKDVTYMKQSLMPPYKLPQQDLDNLLAYLSTLRGEVKAGAGVRKAEGIR